MGPSAAVPGSPGASNERGLRTVAIRTAIISCESVPNQTSARFRTGTAGVDSPDVVGGHTARCATCRSVKSNSSASTARPAPHRHERPHTGVVIRAAGQAPTPGHPSPDRRYISFGHALTSASCCGERPHFPGYGLKVPPAAFRRCRAPAESSSGALRWQQQRTWRGTAFCWPFGRCADGAAPSAAGGGLQGVPTTRTAATGARRLLGYRRRRRAARRDVGAGSRSGDRAPRRLATRPGRARGVPAVA